VEVAVPKATVADDAYPDDVVEEYDPTIPNELDEVLFFSFLPSFVFYI
jgi:hypothetical protein